MLYAKRKVKEKSVLKQGNEQKTPFDRTLISHQVSEKYDHLNYNVNIELFKSDRLWEL